MTRINETHLMIFGPKETYQIDVEENFMVQQGPQLPRYVANKMCGHLKYESNDTWISGDLVVGFSRTGRHMYYWDTRYWTDWIEGPSPPIDVASNCQTVIQRPNDEAMLFLGCKQDNQTVSAELAYVDNEFRWTLRPFELKHQRTDYVAMFIPDELSNCTTKAETKIKVG